MPLEITAIDPAEGPTSGHTIATIRGKEFDPLASVDIGAPVLRMHFESPEELVVELAPGALGTEDVIVTNPATPPVSIVDGYRYADPTVTGIEPDEGPTAGDVANRRVTTVRGTNFEAHSAVLIGGIPATNVTFESQEELTCEVPAEPTQTSGPLDVVVQNCDGAVSPPLVGGYNYEHPTITGVDPADGAADGGVLITVTGTFFVPGAVISVNAQPCTDVIVQSPTTITGRTPHVGAVMAAAVLVTNPDADVTPVAGVHNCAAPVVAAILPVTGPLAGGTPVRITGEHFVLGCTVDIAGQAATNVVIESPTAIRARTPAWGAAVSRDVEVRTAGGLVGTLPLGFRYAAGILATAILPASGSSLGGTPIRIKGTGFGPAMTIHVGGNLATGVVVVSATLVEAVTAAHAAGTEDVVVTNAAAQTHTLAAAFRFRDLTPEVSCVFPPRGDTGNATEITILGSNFAPNATVTIDATAAANVRVISPTLIAATAQGQAAGAKNVIVENTDHRSGRLSDGFAHAAMPTVHANNEAEFIMDGENFFGALADEFNRIRALPRNPLTYIRMAFWMITPGVSLGRRLLFGTATHLLVDYIERVINAGHNIDIIVWMPNLKDRKGGFGHLGELHNQFADLVMQKDATAGLGRARVYLERFEGWTGSSNHQKFAIFSNAGQLTVVLGGINLAEKYFDTTAHFDYPAREGPWHDTAVRLKGPATTDIEDEWMRRWGRAQAMQRSLVSLNDLKKQVRARYAAYGLLNRNTVRQDAVAAAPNATVQNTYAAPAIAPVYAAVPVQIVTTRSTTSKKFMNLRDVLLHRINSALVSIYMENNQFTDRDVVRAIYQRMQAVPALTVAVVTNMSGGMAGYLTRHAWLQIALRLPFPLCRKVYYTSGEGVHQEKSVDRSEAGTWIVHDSYDAKKGDWDKTNRFLADDSLEVPRAAGGTKKIPFDRITKVDCDFHFYAPVRVDLSYTDGEINVDQKDIACHHSKLAIIDAQFLAVGSSNWTYRSMQYDGEISAYIDHPAMAAATLTTLLDHFQVPNPPVIPQLTLANIEAQARRNYIGLSQSRGVSMDYHGQYVIVPLDPYVEGCDLRFPITGNIADHKDMPNFTWL